MTKITDIINEEIQNLNSNTYKVFHGTNQVFDKFDLRKATQGIIWFTDDIDSINNNEHGGMGNKYVMTRYITINNPAGWKEYEKYGLGQIQGMGFDGIILPKGNGKNDFIVFSNKNIRKTDRISNGNRINNTNNTNSNLNQPSNTNLNELVSITNQFIYHGTGKGQALNIQKDGMMKANNVGEEKPSISFTNSLDYAMYYANAKGGKDKAVVLRTKLTTDFKITDRIYNNKGMEYITYKPVSASELEILTPSGWKELNGWNVIFNEPN